MEVLSPDPPGIGRAVGLLAAGEVIAIPTDTVYGLAAGAFDVTAQRRIYELKGRPPELPLILMAASIEALAGVVRLEAAALVLARRFWPGPLTLVVPAGPGLRPPLVKAADGSVGLRIPDHPTALALLAATGPLATTSANRSGEPAAISAAECLELGAAAVLDGGPAPGGVPSTVVAPEPGGGLRLIRQGALAVADLHRALSPA